MDPIWSVVVMRTTAGLDIVLGYFQDANWTPLVHRPDRGQTRESSLHLFDCSVFSV